MKANYIHKAATFADVVNHQLPWLGRMLIENGSLAPSAPPRYIGPQPFENWRTCEACGLPLRVGQDFNAWHDREKYASVRPSVSNRDGPFSLICATCHLGWYDESPPENWIERLMLDHSKPLSGQGWRRRQGWYNDIAFGRRAVFWGRAALLDAVRLRRGIDAYSAHNLIEGIIADEFSKMDTSAPPVSPLNKDLRLLSARVHWRIEHANGNEAKAQLFEIISEMDDQTVWRLADLLKIAIAHLPTLAAHQHEKRGRALALAEKLFSERSD